jgi:hypothetical protein
MIPSPAKQLAGDINYSLTSHHSGSSRKPSTRAEFEAMFKPYEKMMTQFIHNVECGKLQHLGWEPSELIITDLFKLLNHRAIRFAQSNMSVSPLIACIGIPRIVISTVIALPCDTILSLCQYDICVACHSCSVDMG